MFLRRCERRKNGKRHTYWDLVESYRTAKGSRQRVVAYLGELKRSEQDGWAKLGAHLEKGQQSQRPQPSLFDPPSSIEPGREEVPWPTVAAILVLARFCEPASELHIEEKWYPRTALEDLLGIAPEKVHTVKTIIEALEKKYGTLNRVWVMDRGMVSEENLKFMRERNRQYIVGTPKSMLRRFEQHLTEQNWTQAQDGVEVKLVPAPEGDETFIVARSADRRAKELAMHEKFTTRLEAGLKKMQAAAEAGRLKDLAAAGQRLGRLKEQNWRASHAFEGTIKKRTTPRGKQELEITWQRNAKFGDWCQLADGCYLLRSNLTDIDAPTLWKRYIQLTEAEWAFRITKDELSIRPIWHQKEERVKAHILVCFLAYAMWKTLAGWMRGAGLGDAPRTLLYDLAKIKSGDIVLPAETREGVQKIIRLRHVTEPDKAQSVLLHRLGLTLPRRLRKFDEMVQM